MNTFDKNMEKIFDVTPVEPVQPVKPLVPAERNPIDKLDLKQDYQNILRIQDYKRNAIMMAFIIMEQLKKSLYLEVQKEMENYI